MTQHLAPMGNNRIGMLYVNDHQSYTNGILVASDTSMRKLLNIAAKFNRAEYYIYNQYDECVS